MIEGVRLTYKMASSDLNDFNHGPKFSLILFRDAKLLGNGLGKVKGDIRKRSFWKKTILMALGKNGKEILLLGNCLAMLVYNFYLKKDYFFTKP